MTTHWQRIIDRVAAEHEFEADAVPMVVERKGRTECGECVHYRGLEQWMAIPVIVCADLGAGQFLLQAGQLDYCRDFVEAVL